jgi:hypothetical protein
VKCGVTVGELADPHDAPRIDRDDRVPATLPGSRLRLELDDHALSNLDGLARHDARRGVTKLGERRDGPRAVTRHDLPAAEASPVARNIPDHVAIEPLAQRILRSPGGGVVESARGVCRLAAIAR